MGCFSKFFLFVLNFIVFVLGAVVIALASLVLYHGDQFKQLLDTGAFAVPIILLAFGVLITLIGFFGCAGAMCERPCMLYTYAGIVLVLLLAQIGVAAYAAIQKDEFKSQLKTYMNTYMGKLGHGDTDMDNAITAVQQELKCCGVTSYANWLNGTLHSLAKLPKGEDMARGCCKDHTSNACVHVADLSRTQLDKLIYTEGCFTKYDNLVESQAIWMIVGAIALALVQLGCVVIACGIGRQASRRVYA